MSAPQFEPLQPPPSDRVHDLSLVISQAPDGAFFESDIIFMDNELKWLQLSFKLPAEDNPAQHPNIDLISETNIFGGPMGTHPENRLRSATGTLQMVVPGLIELPGATETDFAKNKRPPTIGEVHKDTVKKLDSFLNKSIEVQNYKTARRNLVSRKDVISTYVHEYRRDNHPIIQLIDEIDSRNKNRKVQNAVTPGSAVRVLSQSEIDLLMYDLIIVAERSRIIKRAEQELAKTPLKLAAMLAIHHTLHPYEL